MDTLEKLHDGSTVACDRQAGRQAEHPMKLVELARCWLTALLSAVLAAVGKGRLERRLQSCSAPDLASCSLLHVESC